MGIRVCQLLNDFKKAWESVSGEMLYNIRLRLLSTWNY